MLKKILTITLILLVVVGVGVGTYYLVNSLTAGSGALPAGTAFRGGHLDAAPFAGRGGFDGRMFEGRGFDPRGLERGFDRGFDGRYSGFRIFDFGGGILSTLGLIALITLAVLGIQNLWGRMRQPKAAASAVNNPPSGE